MIIWQVNIRYITVNISFVASTSFSYQLIKTIPKKAAETANTSTYIIKFLLVYCHVNYTIIIKEEEKEQDKDDDKIVPSWKTRSTFSPYVAQVSK